MFSVEFIGWFNFTFKDIFEGVGNPLLEGGDHRSARKVLKLQNLNVQRMS